MDAWEYTDVEAARVAAGKPYHEFLRVPDLSAGIYALEAGAADPQSPHTEDELYYVISGRGVVTFGTGDSSRRPRIADLRRRHRPASVPRHRAAAGDPRHVRTRGGRPRLSRT